MAWIALGDHENQFSSGPDVVDPDGHPVLSCGSLVIETRLPLSTRPKPLVYYNGGGASAFRLSLVALPGGGLTLILDHGSEAMHSTINHSEVARTDILRLTFSWDMSLGWGRLALERSDQDTVVLVDVPHPQPLHRHDIQTLTDPGGDRYLSPELLYLAVSDGVEPVGPVPSLASDTPVLTPDGYRRVRDLRRGDTVLTESGDAVPVLQTVSRRLPARGSFRPLELRAPYFGLKQNIVVSSMQRLVLTGSEVEYLFGHEAVLVPVCHLIGSAAVRPARTGPFVTYTQLLLPKHQALVAAGAFADSLFIGRLHRKKELLKASVLARCDRRTLPDHGGSTFPVLRAFDALILAEQRSA